MFEQINREGKLEITGADEDGIVLTASSQNRTYYGTGYTERRGEQWGYVLRLFCGNCSNMIDKSEVFSATMKASQTIEQIRAFGTDVRRDKASGWVRKFKCEHCSLCPTCGQMRSTLNRPGGMRYGD